MAVQLECINLVIPIKVIEKKYPGGWQQCQRDLGTDEIGATWHDEHLVRQGAMNPMEIGSMISWWEAKGLKSAVGVTRAAKTAHWVDMCVIDFSGPTMPCDWVEVSYGTAYLKGTLPGKVAGYSRSDFYAALPETQAPKEDLRTLLQIPRDDARSIARDTVEILSAGRYRTENGYEINFSAELAWAKAMTVTYAPDQLVDGGEPSQSFNTHIQVVNGSSLWAALELYRNCGNPATVLNMASANMPGGGFLNGARAQEEYLSRNSGLWDCLCGSPMYEYHRQHSSPFYADYVIYSPGVPVIRSDDNELLEGIWPCHFLSSPAVHAGKIRTLMPLREREIEEVMRKRIDRILKVAHKHNCDNLVLGAWGCGAFENDGTLISRLFYNALTTRFAGVFDQVVFAITDWSDDDLFIGPFRRQFR